MRYLFVCIFALTPGFWSVAARAQSEVSDSVRLRNTCRQAEHAISTGRPAPRLRWAWEVAPACGHDLYTRLLVDSVGGTRHSAVLSAMGPIWQRTLNLRDAALFRMLLDIAGDPGASVPARVLAFRSLVQLEHPDWSVRYSDLVGGQNPDARVPFPMGGCMSGNEAAPIVTGGVPLPPDWLQQIHALRTRILAAPGEPEDVRTAASCT
jgi:hypothetical protein